MVGFDFFLQNVLKVYQIGPSSVKNSRDEAAVLGSKIWNELDNEAKEVLTPFLNSQYIVGGKGTTVDPGAWKTPLFGYVKRRAKNVQISKR